ncbi:alpha/beta hydrolase family protein [Roseiconus lacunae]|uniref:alpha/beta hydrolase family protein n=1 Tax=Roseiconus lacunae TaxID=2605694 RepID=UPI0011F390F5|nr:alpha/beta fold hydrolase [Roseiconus lacunae]
MRHPRNRWHIFSHLKPRVHPRWILAVWVAILIAFPTVVVDAQSGDASGPWQIERWKQTPAMRWLDRESPVRSLTYELESIAHRPGDKQGEDAQPTEVFAFYATPGTVNGDPSLDKDLPAVVLIHGGGGTAFSEWAWLWAQRGYAAIAMDLSGRRPEAPRFNPKTRELIIQRRVERTRLPSGGPEANHQAKFNNIGGDRSDEWQPYAVAAVIQAHSLIRSFPEVDAERTAVTGISWGGYMTCLVASLDDRFSAAVPVYGCGFLYEGESVQKPMIDALSGDQRQQWIRDYDPSAWLPQCDVPILLVNGTNDKHYPLDSYMKSFQAVAGPKQLRIEVAMPHGHVAGWLPNEIGLFIDQHVSGGKPLPKLESLHTTNGIAKTKIDSSTPIKTASLHFTTDHGPLVGRSWGTQTASIDGDLLSATVPSDATLWYLSVTDERDAMISTDVQFSVDWK